MTLTDDDYAVAVRRGHEVAVAVAIKRFRDEYGWTAEQVKEVCHQLLDKIDDNVRKGIDCIASDITRMEDSGRPKESMQCAIIASMALIGAQVCEGLEMARRAGRN